MRPFHPSLNLYFGSKKRRQGSALLLTLLVVSLLLVIVLAFVTFVRLELRQVEANHHRLQAQSSAKLGMVLALTSLQDLTAPDQRVTARADMFDNSTANEYQNTLAANAEKSKWVGVWDASSYNENDPTLKGFLGWLVSGDEADVDQVDDVGSAFSQPDKLITLVGPGTVELTADQVKVPKVSAGTGLNYAWWVKDENITARFDTSDPFRNSSDPVERQFSLHSAQRFGIEMMDVDPSTVLGEIRFPHEDPAFTNRMERVAQLNQAPLIWKNSASNMAAYQTLIRNRYHDLSIVSRGLLVDVRNGGLRQDLSMAFEMPYDEWVDSDFVEAHPNAEEPLYQPPGYPAGRLIAPLIRIDDFSLYGFSKANDYWPESGKGPDMNPPVPYDSPDPSRIKADRSSSIAPVLRGPSWDLFRNYYRLYKSNDPDLTEYGYAANLNLQSDGSLKGRSHFPSAHGVGTARRNGQDPLVWDYAEGFGSGVSHSTALPIGRSVLPGVSPVVTRLQYVLSFKTREVAAGVYQLDMYLDPIVTIWNPYNVRLKTGRSNGQPLILGVQFLNLKPFVEATVPGDPAIPGDPDVTKLMYQSFSILFDAASYAKPGSDYSESSDQTFQMEVARNGITLEPGEVLVYSHAGPALPYYRNEDLDPDSSTYSSSGVSIDLDPGIDNLQANSGLLFENIIPHLEENDLFSGGNIAGNVELRFKLQPGAGDLKYNVAGIGADGKEPFLSSFLAGVHEISTDFTASDNIVSDLEGVKLPVVFFDTYLKDADSPQSINLVSQFNVRAQTYDQGSYFKFRASANLPSQWFDKYDDAVWGEGKIAPDLNSVISMSGNNGYWGPNNSGDGNVGLTHIPLFDIPRAPMTSLASFQHVPVSVMADEPSFVVGNSAASIFVGYSPLSLQKLRGNNVDLSGSNNRPGRSDWTMTRVDWSYLLNQVLFDSYFFSGIAPNNDFSSSKALFVDHIQNNTPLHNSQVHFRAAHGQNPDDIANSLFDGSGDPNLYAPREIASHLMVDGMFNINSTSVEAWKALLASTRKIEVETEEDGDVDSTGSVYTRMSIPHTGENEEWTGFRSLTDVEINNLAKEIVIQVKERGPFLNLSDFVNRRAADRSSWSYDIVSERQYDKQYTPDPDDVHAHMKMGALEAAIQASGINDSYFSETLDDKNIGPGNLNMWVRDRVDIDSKVAAGAAGHVTQADLLSVIGPVLSARSDTFTIRSYGEFEDHAGNVISRAWCEAVVQRVPEYQDSSSGGPSSYQPHETPVNTGSYDTQLPRRKYEIIQFRWLDPEEI